MKKLTIPNFGELLSPHLTGVAPQAYPFLLSQLERTAAARYRMWADEVPEHRDGLMKCAEREVEIADRVEAMFPPDDEARAQVAAVIPEAKAVYYSVFESHSPTEQMTIQADAEKQGSKAWQNLKAAYPDHADELDGLTALELESAVYLDQILA